MLSNITGRLSEINTLLATCKQEDLSFGQAFEKEYLPCL